MSDNDDDPSLDARPLVLTVALVLTVFFSLLGLGYAAHDLGLAVLFGLFAFAGVLLIVLLVRHSSRPKGRGVQREPDSAESDEPDSADWSASQVAGALSDSKRRTREISGDTRAEDPLKPGPLDLSHLGPEIRRDHEKVGPASVEKPSESRAVPAVPEELLPAFLTRSCVLFAGTGLAAHAGGPLWTEGWSRVLEEVTKEQPSQNWDNLRNAQKKGEIAALVDLLRARLSHEALVQVCGRVFADLSPERSSLHREIGEIPFAGILTTAWDRSLDDTFDRRRPALLFPNDSHLFGPVLREKQFFVLKINGDASRPDTFAFSAEDYRRGNRLSCLCSEKDFHRFK